MLYRNNRSVFDEDKDGYGYAIQVWRMFCVKYLKQCSGSGEEIQTFGRFRFMKEMVSLLMVGDPMGWIEGQKGKQFVQSIWLCQREGVMDWRLCRLSKVVQ